MPSPGKHCTNCVGASRCPIESDAREKYAVTSQKQAERMVAELEVADAIRKSHREALRGYVEEHGPVGARWSKGTAGVRVQDPEGRDAGPDLLHARREPTGRRSAPRRTRPSRTPFVAPPTPRKSAPDGEGEV